MQKTWLSFLAVFLLAIPCVLGLTVSHQGELIPGRVSAVKLLINGAVPDQTLVIEDTLPAGVQAIRWDISGTNQDKEEIDVRLQGTSIAWSFKPNFPNPVITYFVNVSSTAQGPYYIENVYFDPNGFNQSTAQLGKVSNGVTGMAGVESLPGYDSNGSKKTEGYGRPSSPSGAAAVQRPRSFSSVVVGILIASLIVFLGLGIFYGLTKPKRRK